MMTFNVRSLEVDDYDNYLVGWWNDWGWEAPTKDFLPGDGVGGMMVLDADGTPICAGFVYLSNSKVAWVDWIISNKGYKKKPNRTYAIRLLIEKLTNYCEAKGRVYKNYKSALRNFVLGDMQKQVERSANDKYRGVDATNVK